MLAGLLQKDFDQRIQITLQQLQCPTELKHVGCVHYVLGSRTPVHVAPHFALA